MTFPPELVAIILGGLLAGILLLLALIFFVLIAGRRRREPHGDRLEPAPKFDRWAEPEGGGRRASIVADYLERARTASGSPPGPPRPPSRFGWLVAGIIAGVAAALPWADPVLFDRLVTQAMAPIEGFLAAGVVRDTGTTGSIDEDRVPTVGAN